MGDGSIGFRQEFPRLIVSRLNLAILILALNLPLMEACSMAVLSTKRRNSLGKSTFGLPGQRKYPMPDRAHAANAEARATQQFKKGNLSSGAKAKIMAKAHGILGKIR